MSPLLHSVLNWVTQNPTWAGIAVFLISLSESLVVVGLFVPGVIMMFGIGALVAAGAMELFPTLAWAAAGAVAGDGMSYWVGYHYQDRLRTMWPFSRHPQLLARGEEFFRRHGGKSIVFGRFVGPVRPIVPVVAGMLRMRASRFLFTNVLSAVTWAPTYTLPGVVFGASLGIASQVATRLATIAVILLVLFWVSLWGVRALVNFLQPRAEAAVAHLSSWGSNHPRLGAPVAALFDPMHREIPTLLGLALLLGLATWAFLLLQDSVANAGALSYLDRGVFLRLQELRTPWSDSLMVLLSELGDGSVLIPLFAAVLLWLLLQRQRLAAAHWTAAAAFGLLITWVMQHGMLRPRSGEVYEDISVYDFTLTHVALSTSVYGFLAILIARELPPERRWLPYSCASLIILSVALSRIYLGVQWVTDVVAGLLLGLVWVLVLGSAYRHHQTARVPLRGLLLTAMLTLGIAAGWHITRHHAQDMDRFAVQYRLRVLTLREWQEGGWQSLPTYRLDITGEVGQPLTLQWAGDLDRVREYLEARGWHEPTPLDWKTALSWLTAEPKLSELPMLPKVHDGRHEALVLVHALPQPDRQLILRLWSGDVILQEGEQPVWIGYAALVDMTYPLKLLALLRTSRDFNTPLEMLRSDLDKIAWTEVRRPPRMILSKHRCEWNGAVLLLRSSD